MIRRFEAGGADLAVLGLAVWVSPFWGSAGLISPFLGLAVLLSRFGEWRGWLRRSGISGAGAGGEAGLVFGPRAPWFLACALVYKLASKRGRTPVSAGARAHSVAIRTDFGGASAVDGLAPVRASVRFFQIKVHARARACPPSFAAPEMGRGRGARPSHACRGIRADPRIPFRVPLFVPTCCHPARGRSY